MATTKVSASINPFTYKQAKLISEHHGCSMSQYITIALQKLNDEFAREVGVPTIAEAVAEEQTDEAT